MPEDARVSQGNSKMTPEFPRINTARRACGQVDPAVPKATLLFHMVGVVVPRSVARVARLYRRSFNCAALVLLSGARGTHRQFETRIVFESGRRGKYRRDDDKGANRGCSRNVLKHHVHDEAPASEGYAHCCYHNLHALAG